MHRSISTARQILRRSRLFARIGDADLDAILAHSTIARHAEGEQIFAKGDPGSSMMALPNRANTRKNWNRLPVTSCSRFTRDPDTPLPS